MKKFYYLFNYKQSLQEFLNITLSEGLNCKKLKELYFHFQREFILNGAMLGKKLCTIAFIWVILLSWFSYSSLQRFISMFQPLTSDLDRQMMIFLFNFSKDGEVWYWQMATDQNTMEDIPLERVTCFNRISTNTENLKPRNQ